MFTAEEKKNRILTTAKIYSETKSLTVTGQKLNLTRERVRQVLLEGQKMGLIQYTPSDTLKKDDFNSLIEKYPRTELVHKIIEAGTRAKAIENLGLDQLTGKQLIKHYNITRQDYLSDTFRNKYMADYVKLFNELGHHPSVTELQEDKKTRILYNALCRYWGGIENFRKEFGVEKTQYFMNRKGYVNWLQAVNRGKLTKETKKTAKKAQVMQVLTQKKFINCVEFMRVLGFSRCSTMNYLKELEAEGVVKSIPMQGKLFYRADLTHPKSMLYLKQKQDERILQEN